MSARKACDVMISFVKEDEKFGMKLAGDLSKHFNVWKPSGDSSSDVSAAVVDCKVFIVVMSLSSVQSKSIRDQVALAYVSHRFIIPVGRTSYPEISARMNAAMLLTLAKINWIILMHDDEYSGKLENFFKDVRRALADYGDFKPEEMDDVRKGMYTFNRQLSVKRSDSHCGVGGFEDATDSARHISGGRQAVVPGVDFWQRHWGSECNVEWAVFEKVFVGDYGAAIETSFGQSGREMLIGLMQKDIFESRSVLSRETYDTFCGKQEADEDDPSDHFFNCLRDYTVGYLAMREVFNMESSVRLAAIQNLGKFQTPSVIGSLADLTEDADPNVRAIAALGLARAGKSTRRVQEALVRLLDDEDRLVRQSTCLAVAVMATREAVDKLADLWRNDPFSQVREAAKLALENIGGEDAVKVLSVTCRLSDEMRWLRAS